MSAVTIVPAHSGDLSALIALGRRMHTETTIAFPAIDRDAVAAHLRLTLAGPDRFYVAIARRDASPIGFVNGVIGSYAFSADLRGCCDMLYVVPERRGGPAGMRLLRGFRDWAARHGAGAVYLGLSTGIAPDRSAALVQRLGYTPLGQTFRQEIEKCAAR